MKKILFFLMAVCLLSALVACGQPEPTENVTNLPEGISYGIKVVDTAGEPVVGALVSICQDKEGGICYMPVKTDENGMAYFYADKVPVQENMKVQVKSGGGYDLPMADGQTGYIIIPNGTTEMTLTVLVMPE